jgi:glycerophosphoryl diester phosphodiesterase family protein
MTTPLRPLTMGELLDRTFYLYRKHFVLFAGIIALPHLIYLAFQLVGVAIRPGMGSSITFAISTVFWSLGMVVIYLGAIAASQGATVIAVSQVHLERPASVIDSFRLIGPRVVSLSLMLIAIGLAIGIGFLLLIIPGLILLSMWSLTIPVAVLENKGLSDSVNRSAELTKGDRGKILLIYLLFVVLVWGISMLINLPVIALVGVIARGNPEAMMGWPQVALALSGFLTQCLVGPLLTIALALVYYDERVRKEAFDIQLMMATLDGPQAGAASAT